MNFYSTTNIQEPVKLDFFKVKKTRFGIILWCALLIRGSYVQFLKPSITYTSLLNEPIYEKFRCFDGSIQTAQNTVFCTCFEKQALQGFNLAQIEYIFKNLADGLSKQQ